MCRSGLGLGGASRVFHLGVTKIICNPRVTNRHSPAEGHSLTRELVLLLCAPGLRKNVMGGKRVEKDRFLQLNYVLILDCPPGTLAKIPRNTPERPSPLTLGA